MGDIIKETLEFYHCEEFDDRVRQLLNIVGFSENLRDNVLLGITRDYKGLFQDDLEGVLSHATIEWSIYYRPSNKKIKALALYKIS